ncbi:hypothetical protein [Virgisporangium aurantiacum]|uniref:Uncharacterized protein n=1 Tax=Virgisporangium aurantiacum TaxID=175570 RepID=A0A8J4E6I6_9ACTN|nr:hypothetical protein [Virgisporangium aurantiacum]GIJ63264.1 hypothetical protein Vau01_107800 [Virgisporangium aurantiacum]
MSLGFRWRRDGWLVGSVVLATVIIATAAVVGSSSTEAVRPVPSGGPALEPLPAGRFGRATLVYWGCATDCYPVVRFGDGREFEVPTDATSTRGVTLSPDGRWLGYPLGTGLVVRDLVGSSAEHRFGSPAVGRRMTAWAWSADSAVLLVSDEGADQVPTGFTLLWVEDGTRMPLPAWPGHEVLGVRLPVQLLVAQPNAPAGSHVDLALTTATGEIATWFTVDAAAQLRAGERLVPNGVRFSGTGTGFEAVVLNRDDDPTAVLRFGTNDAEDPIIRHDLPTTGSGRWSYLGVGPDGTAFAHHEQGRTRLRYLAPDGTINPGPDLPPDPVRVVPPGVAVY